MAIDPNGVMLRGKDGSVFPLQMATSHYRIYCDHLPAGSNPIKLVFAVDRKPSRITIDGSYDLVDGDKRVKKTVNSSRTVKVY